MLQSEEYRKSIRPGDAYLRRTSLAEQATPRDAVISVDPNDPRASAISKKSILSVKTPFFIGHTHFCTTNLRIWQLFGHETYIKLLCSPGNQDYQKIIHF